MPCIVRYTEAAKQDYVLLKDVNLPKIRLSASTKIMLTTNNMRYLPTMKNGM